MKPRHRLVFFLLLLAISFLPCCQALAQELEVRGRVLDADGAPMAKVTVQLVPLVGGYVAGLDALAGRHATEAAVETTTNLRGAYRLKAPEAGMWWVRVEARGHLAMGHRLMPLLTDVEVPPAQMVPAQFLPVRVLDEQGKALPGVLVAATNDRRRQADEWFLQRFDGLTDEQGLVKVPHPENARLNVFAYHPEYLEGRLKDVSSAASISLARGKIQPILVQDHQGKPLPDVLARVGEGHFALGTTDAEGRIAVPCREEEDLALYLLAPDLRNWRGVLRANPGEPPEEDVLTIEALTALEGRVVESTRRDPVAGALVWVGYQVESVVRSNSRGEFHLPLVAAGGAWLQAAAAGYFSALSRADYGADKAPTLILEPTLAVVGRVVDEGGEPLGQVAVRATVLDRRGFGPALQQSGGTTSSEENGTFRLRRLVARASYQVEFSLPGYVRTQQILVAPKAGEPFEFEVVMAEGRMAFGLVVDAEEQPVEGAEVTLVRQEAGLEPWLMVQRAGREDSATVGRARSGKGGRFELADMGTGRYRLEVKRSGFAATTVPGIEIPEDSPEEGFDLGTLVLVPGERLVGRVVDEKGKAVAGSVIYARSRDTANLFSSHRAGRNEPSAVADEEGRFVVPDRRNEEVLDLTAAHPGFLRATLSGVEVPTSEEVVLTLRKASSLAGKVVTEGGEGFPVWGFR